MRDNHRCADMRPIATKTKTSSLFDSRIEAAKAGEEWAWEEIYADLAASVTGYVRSRGARDPEDVASEVFLQVARDIKRFTGDEVKFRSWVFVIAHRRVIDARRSKSRQPDIVADATFDIASEDGDVEEEVLEQLAVTHLRDVFELLTDEQKHVLALRLIADLSLEETAEVMGKRVGAIKALQRRALAAVKTQLESGRVTI
jgi:RNA polymerase sigma-70 factor, ECF subfamily